MQDLPPELISNFVKFLDILLVENGHVVAAFPAPARGTLLLVPNPLTSPLLSSQQQHHPCQPLDRSLAVFLMLGSFKTETKRGKCRKEPQCLDTTPT